MGRENGREITLVQMIATTGAEPEERKKMEHMFAGQQPGNQQSRKENNKTVFNKKKGNWTELSNRRAKKQEHARKQNSESDNNGWVLPNQGGLNCDKFVGWRQTDLIR